MLKKLLLYCCALMLLASCNGKKEEKKAAIQLNDPVKNQYASYFKIYKQDSLSVLVTYLDVEKTDSAMYILYSGEKPAYTSKAHYVKTPVTNVASFSSVFIGFLDELNTVNSVIAVDNGDFISNPIIKEKIANKQVKELGKGGQPNMEELLVSGINIIFSNPSGDARKDFDTRLLKANIIPIVCADYLENHPLGRAEWIKAMALFFNKEHIADSLFHIIEGTYLVFKNSVDIWQVKPSVFTEVKTGDSWFIPGGKSFMAQLLTDAGADYLWKDNDKTGSLALNMEQVMEKALKADFWLNQQVCGSKEELLKQDKRYAEFNAVKKGNLYNNNALLNENGGNAYWETGLTRPDEILRDLIKIFHPTLQPGYNLKYYKQLK